jgi:hypothetical protein
MKAMRESLNVVTAILVAVIVNMKLSTILSSARMVLGYSSFQQIMSG